MDVNISAKAGETVEIKCPVCGQDRLVCNVSGIWDNLRQWVKFTCGHGAMVNVKVAR